MTHPDLLQHLRAVFPESGPDANLARGIEQGLEAAAALKTPYPHLGRREPLDHAAARAARLPERLSGVEATLAELATYLEGLPLWGHPRSQANVSPPTTVPAVVGQLFAALYSPNLLGDEAGQRVGLAELETAAICADLIGYDPQISAGVFTFGGTGALLYGAKLGIEKAAPGAIKAGVPQGLKLFASDAAHHAKLNVLGWLGIGTDGLVTVASGPDNAMDIHRLESLLRASLERGEKPACIVATLGTTDAFGLDELAAIVNLRDRLAAEYRLPYLPHIHADAVIGWAFAVFDGYDFAANSMEFPARAVPPLREIYRRVRDLRLADSVGLDFHKTGFAPYTSSLFLCRRREDLDLIARDPALMPYVCQTGGYQPGLFTLETSRGGGAILAALANLKLLGREGYRALLAHLVDMAQALRERLADLPYVCVVNPDNPGPATLFRVYPEGVAAQAAYVAETTRGECRAQLRRHNAYNRAVSEWLRRELERGESEGGGIALSHTERYRTTPQGEPILALKSFVMSPFTTERDMDALLECLERARRGPGLERFHFGCTGL